MTIKLTDKNVEIIEEGIAILQDQYENLEGNPFSHYDKVTEPQRRKEFFVKIEEFLDKLWDIIDDAKEAAS